MRPKWRTGLGKLCAAAMIGGVVGAAAPARADEGGVAFWLSGQYASLAAIPATPGPSAVLFPYYYNGNAGKSQILPRGSTLTTGLDSQIALMLVQAGYAPQQKLWGGQPYVGVSGGVGRNQTGVSASAAPNSALQLNAFDSKTGGTDLYPIASLAWNNGTHNWMTYITGDIPVGAYDSKRLANLGIGHGAVDAGAGYTYLDSSTGREWSAVAGLTYNLRNSDTNYKNGVDLHIDWAASQFLSASWQVGLVGYVYQQLSADQYPTNGIEGTLRSQLLGSFKSGVASLGPELGYVFKVGSQQAYANLRAYWEFWAKNRIQGYAVMATVSLPL